MLFPTNLSAELFEYIRIRMSIGPNVIVAFSNEDLPQALGFTANQIGAKVQKQIQFNNSNLLNFISLFCQGVANIENRVFNTKIHLYPKTSFVTSPIGTLKTTKKRERKPELMAQDYSTSIADLASSLNFSFKLEHDVTGKKI